MRLNQVTVRSTNLAESVRFYTLLGLVQIVASDHYARFVCPDGDATFSIDAVNDVAPGAGPVIYFECDDLDAKVEEAGIPIRRSRSSKRGSSRIESRRGSTVICNN